MVAYSFQKRFCDDVAEGRKNQTIRGNRKRHAKVGEPVQLYYAMRTKHCRKLRPDPICESVEPISIWIGSNGIVTIGDSREIVTNAFAKADGFTDASDFSNFWRETYGPGVFHGVVIKWSPPTGSPNA